MGFAMAVAYMGWGHAPRWGWGHILGMKSFKTPKSGSVESNGCEILHKGKFFKHNFFLTLDLSKCLVLI